MKYLLKTLFVLILLISSHTAFGANTYLDNRCFFNGNGTAGNCASSGGGAGAYNTGASIFWATIGSNNTLYIARGTTVGNWAGIIVDTAVTIDDYGDPALSCATWTYPSATSFVMSINQGGVTVNDICVTGSSTSALISTVKASTTINRVTLYSNAGSGVGMRFNTGSSDGSINDSTIYDIYDDGVGVSNLATGMFTVKNLTCYNVDRGLGIGDCIQVYDDAISNLTVDGGWFRRETPYKQAIRYHGTGTVTVKNRPYIDVSTGYDGGFNGAQGISMDGTSTLNISSIYIKGNDGAPAIFTHNNGTSTISGAILEGGEYGIWMSHPRGLYNIFNNTIVGQDLGGLYHTTDGSSGTAIIKNNYIDAPINISDVTPLVTTIANYNRYGSGTFLDDANTRATLALWQSNTGQDNNSAVASAGFVGGSFPNNPYGFRISGGSTLRGTGTHLPGNLTDFFGRPYEYTPSIGAFESGSRDFSGTRIFR